jgi:hypothetical protein
VQARSRVPQYPTLAHSSSMLNVLITINSKVRKNGGLFSKWRECSLSWRGKLENSVE